MKTLKITLVGVALLIGAAVASRAQNTATWIGPVSGGEWNTGANWDGGLAPADSTTNAIIGPTFNVNYNLPMTATSFGALTNQGILNVNTNGFNSGPLFLINPAGTSKLFVNTGAVVNVTGNVALCSNALLNVSAGSSLTISGTFFIGSGTNNGTGSGSANSFGTVTNNGGNITTAATSLNSPNGSVGGPPCNLFVINGGTNNLGNVFVGRAGGSGSGIAIGQEGLVINGGLVNMTNLLVGNNSWGAMLVRPGATVTNTGDGRIRCIGNTASRPARMYQSGGLYVTLGTNYLATSNAANVAVSFAVTGGTNYSKAFFFGDPLFANLGTVNFTNASVMYVGSGGIASNGAVTVNASLNNGGLFGASADWSGAPSMNLSGVNSVFTFQAADANGTAHNITLNGNLNGSGGLKKTGSGTLTLNGVNGYAGSTFINNATLALGASGTITVSPIIVGSGATFDVTAVSGGYSVNPLQTLAGSGSVSGTVTVASTGTINPGSNDVSGTLTFQNDVVETNGAVNHFDLSGDPNAPDNDFVVVNGTLNASGVNTVEIGGAPQNQAVYKLFQYGTFSGSLANFTTSSGTLSNNAVNKIIYLIAFSTNHPPTNVIWLGNSTANNWDMLATTNWSINGTGPATNFVTGDKARFDNTGAANALVNLVGTVKPGSVTVDSTADYTFSTVGSGTIISSGGLTKTNSGTLTISTINGYSGVTTIGGGTLQISNIANGSVSSPIGAANTDPANLVLNGGTLKYFGATASTDRGATVGGTTSAIAVTTNGNLTISGTLIGSGGLTKLDGGTLILSGANSYSGTTTLSNGTLQISSTPSALAGTVVFDGGTLSLNVGSQQTYPNDYNVVTTGTVNSAGSANNIMQGAWSGSGTLNIRALTGTFSLNADMTTNFTGTIRLTDDSTATFRFNAGGGSGGAQQCTGSPTVTFDLGNSSVILLNRNGGGASFGTYFLGALAGGTNTTVRGSANASSSSTYQIGGNNLNSTFSGKIANGAGGTAATVGITKVGSGTLTLDGGVNVQITTPDGFNFVTNTFGSSTNLSYSGSTIISNGVLRLVSPVTLTNTANSGGIPTPITLASATAVLDGLDMGFCTNEFDSDGVTVTNFTFFTNGVFELAPNQSLTGIGTIRATNVLVDANSRFNPGLPMGTLNASQKIELAGAVNMNVNAIGTPNCSEIVSPTIVVDGTAVLTVTNLGPEAGATFQLFSQPVSGFFSVNLPSLSGTNSWINNLAVNGSITLVAPPYVNLTPTNIVVSYNPGNGTLTLSWPQDHISWRLQSQTNTLAVGLGTNWVDVAGSDTTNQVTLPVDHTKGSLFFRMIH